MRACEQEVRRTAPGGTLEQLKEAQAFAEAYLRKECAYLEEHMDYHAIPIKQLVTVQAKCGLLAAQYISREQRHEER